VPSVEGPMKKTRLTRFPSLEIQTTKWKGLMAVGECVDRGNDETKKMSKPRLELEAHRLAIVRAAGKGKD